MSFERNKLTWPHTWNWFLTRGCQFFRFLPNYLEILSSFKPNARKQLGMYFQSGTQGSAVPYKFWPFAFLLKIHAHFAKWKIAICKCFVWIKPWQWTPLKILCPLTMPSPRQAEFSLQYRVSLGQAVLGAQTDRREPVWPLFSVTSASGGLQFEQRDFSFGSGIRDCNWMCRNFEASRTRPKRWAGLAAQRQQHWNRSLGEMEWGQGKERHLGQ